MAYIDVFNGDADGVCSLQQLRLNTPCDSQLVTGVKRDISLLKRVEASPGDEITVLDISLDKNRDALVRILDQGSKVTYFDHHFAGDIPTSQHLSAHIDTAADTCTSLIVDRFLDGKYRAWAVVGAFGDNFDDSARRVAQSVGLNEGQLDLLRQLGIYMNYNGYGATVEDLLFAPDALYRLVSPFADPLAFIHEEAEAFATLRDGYNEDIAKAENVAPELVTDQYALYIFPAEAWARRVSGVFSNQLASGNPGRAHALLTYLPEGGFVVSIRAPLNNKSGADELCRSFPTGGGRKAAAGINNLPEDQYDGFVEAFVSMYGKP